jgi:hypothetical protein
VVNNVETLCKAAMIAQKGGAWFSGLGTKQSTGTKLLSISGDVENQYEYPPGVSVAQVLADCGAGNAQAVQISGASASAWGCMSFPGELLSSCGFLYAMPSTSLVATAWKDNNGHGSQWRNLQDSPFVDRRQPLRARSGGIKTLVDTLNKFRPAYERRCVRWILSQDSILIGRCPRRGRAR